MSSGGWSSLHGNVGGGWGGTTPPNDEALFLSLSPVNGLLTGEQVKLTFRASGLPQQRLAQIWMSVDQDGDGRINQPQFLMAMTLIRQAKLESLNTSLPAAGFASFPTPSVNPLAQSWASPKRLRQQTPPLGVGVGVSMTTMKEGWALSTQDRRRYTMQFNTLDKNKIGKLLGIEVAPMFAKTGLHTGVLAKIWELVDVNQDGRLACEEFVVAMHLAERVKSGLTLPRILPAELYPGPTKYATIDRKAHTPTSSRADKPLEKRSSVIDPADWASRQSTPSSEDIGRTFEDKRKNNFEAGRMELERRRRALQEEQERISAEKERKRREEEERRLQQEREAEQARQAELERQRLKAMEIEKDRVLQMQRLALQREVAQREIDRKRKEEWARKRQAELEGERLKERNALQILKDQHSRLEQELMVMDQRRLGAQASIERQRMVCVEMSKVIRTLHLSREVRLEELRKARGELNSLQAQVLSLHQQRGALQVSLEQRSEDSGFQLSRKALNDQVMGLAALMAGLRTNLSHNREEADKLRSSFLEYQHILKGLNSTHQSEEINVHQLRILVDTRKRACQDKQQRESEEREQRAAEERRKIEEQEKLQREIDERARREQRLVKIKRDQEMAKKKAALNSVMADLSAARSSPPSAKKTTPPTSNSPALTKKSKKEEAAKDKEVLRKVQELQARKQKLLAKESDRKLSDGAAPSKPLPYVAHRIKNIIKPRPMPPQPYKETKTATSNELVDLMSSWETKSGTIVGARQFKKDTSQILTPIKQEVGVAGNETPPPIIDHVVVSPTGDGGVQVTPFTQDQHISDDSAIYAIPRSLIGPRESAVPTSDTGQRSIAEAQQVPTSDMSQSSITEAQKVPTSDTGQSSTGEAQQVRYRVVFNYETSDPSEVNLQEGDLVTSDPSVTPPPGWLMVSIVASGESGWAPESYLQLLSEETKVESEVIAEERVLSPPTLMAVVLFSWQGSKDNHLSIVKDERIAILQQGEKWWSGEREGQVGWFPRTFVKLEATKDDKTTTEDSLISEAAASSLSPTTELTNQNAPINQVYEAIYDYENEAEGDLNFKAGDVIQVTVSEGDWWSGVLNGVTGSFPSNYVQPRYEMAPPRSQSSPLETTPTPQPTPISQPTPTQGEVTSLTKPIVAKVVVAFQALKDGQLTLLPGDLIKVSKQASNGWWEGEQQVRGRQRMRGWFPANRVEPLGLRKHSSSSITSLPARARSPLLEVLEDRPRGGSENLVLALYTYSAQSSDELSFPKGSVVTVLSKDGDWWRGELNGEAGLFPSNYVQPLMEQASSAEPTRWADSVSSDVLAAVTDQERKRQEAIFELLTSERHYTTSLKLVKEVFFDPMYETNALSEEDIAKVMVNWDELIECSGELLKAFMVRLRTSGAIVKSIGDVLVNQIPDLTPHVRWCSCQLNACTLLQQKSSDPTFREFEQKCKADSRTGGLPLSSFLLKPMQRVTKYPLLIKRILSYTQEGEFDHDDLRKALDHAEKLCDQVNEAVRRKENTEQLEWLQTHIHFSLDERLVFNSATNFMGSRRLLHWGKLFKIRGAKDVLAFLFNDFLLMVKPKLFFPRAAAPTDLEPFGKNEFQMYRQPFLLENLRVKKGSNDQHGPSVFLLTHGSEDKDIPLRADSDHKRDQWLKVITKACLEFITTKKKMEREKKEQRLRTMKDSVGFLKVTVVEASDLLAKDPNGKSDPFCVLTLGRQQEQTTPTVPLSLNPKWNHTLEFYVHDINKDELEVTVFDKDLFSPNDFLGAAKLSLKDLFRDGDSPWTKRLLLEDVAKGEIELKIELELKASDLLL